jgi:peptidoglycan hydrolase-like protein with peptidoglycan-binding domain
MGNFLTSTGLAASLQIHNWAAFARGYNGPNYAINRYDIKLNAEYQKYSAAGIPDLNIRATQLYLTYLGFHPGSVDGIAGQHTLDALAQFQAQNGIQPATAIDDQCVAQLQDALAKTLSAAA